MSDSWRASWRSWPGTIGDQLDIGQAYQINFEMVGAIAGSESRGALRILISGMIDQGLCRGRFLTLDLGQLELDYRGMIRLEELGRGSPSGFNAFMAMKFGDKDADRVVEEHFKPAIRETGFELYRLDDRPQAGLIDARLRNEIRNCRFLIADLSHANAGAYWEAGYAEGLGKPVIYTCEKSVFDGNHKQIGKPHFDTNHHLTIVWEHGKVAEAATRLADTIRFTIPEATQKSR